MAKSDCSLSSRSVRRMSPGDLDWYLQARAAVDSCEGPRITYRKGCSCSAGEELLVAVVPGVESTRRAGVLVEEFIAHYSLAVNTSVNAVAVVL